MRTAALIALAVVACAGAACSGGGAAKSTPIAGSPTAPATSLPHSPTAAATAAATATASAATIGFPARCSSFVASADIDALAAQHLRLADDSTAGASGATAQLVCRFEGTGTGGDSAIIVVATRYANAATAVSEDGNLRSTAEAQGGKFTKIDGLEDEAYSFVYPSASGVAARRGSATVSVGVGKLLGVPATTEFTALVKSLLSKLGS